MAPISETQTTTATATATVKSAAQASTLRLRPEREAWQEQLDKEGECMQIRASAVHCRLSTVGGVVFYGQEPLAWPRGAGGQVLASL